MWLFGICDFLFDYLHYFDLLGVWFGFLWSGLVFFFSFPVPFSPYPACLPPCTKQISTKAWTKGMPLELIRRHFLAFRTLSSEPYSVVVQGYLDEAIWLSVCVTDQRTHLASRIKMTFGKEGELWFCRIRIPHPLVRLCCAVMGGGRHRARRRMGSYPNFPPVHCGTGTELAGPLVPVFSTCKIRVIIPPFH